MALTQVIHLTQETYGLPPIVHMVQNDTGRELMMVIDDVELSGSPTAVLYWMRSDLTHYSTNAEFDSQNNAFTADVSQALTQPFNTQCQLKVTDSNDVIVSTYTFIIDVQTDVDGTSEAQLGYSIEEITEIIDSARGGGMSEDVKQALLNCFEHVAWTDEHGQDYVDALEAALYPPAVLVSITAYYNQTGTIYDTDDLDDLKPDLTVMANYDNGQSVPVSTYTLSGSLVAGTSTIRVNYDTKYTTFDVTVTHMPGIISVVNNLVNATNSNSATTVSEGDSYTATISPASGYTLTGASVIITMGNVDITSSAYSNGVISIDEVTDTLTISVSAVAVTLVSISAVYTQSGTVYDTDSLDSLKNDLVVTATWSDTSTSTVSATDYTLSGTLTVGTSTVTVSYGGKTTTFTVTVTYLDTTLYNWDLKTSLTDSVGNVTASTTATFTSGTGLVFDSDNKYCDFGETYARDRTYEFDVLSIGSTGTGHRRTLMFDTDASTSQGGAGLIFSSNKGGWIFYTGTAWDSSTIVSGTDKYNIFDGKTVKVELNSNGIASVYSKTIGADDSTYTFVGSSTNALKDYTNGHVYLGSSSSDYLAPATFTGLRIKGGVS